MTGTTPVCHERPEHGDIRQRIPDLRAITYNTTGTFQGTAVYIWNDHRDLEYLTTQDSNQVRRAQAGGGGRGAGGGGAPPLLLCVAPQGLLVLRWPCAPCPPPSHPRAHGMHSHSSHAHTPR